MFAGKAPLLGSVLQSLHQDVGVASRGDGYLSKRESQTSDALIRQAYQEARSRHPDRWVPTDEAARGAVDIVSRSLSVVTGRERARYVTQREIKKLAAFHPEAGARCAKAYELLTGKAVELAGNPRVTLPVAAKTAVYQSLADAFGVGKKDVKIRDLAVTHGGFSMQVETPEYKGPLFAAKPFDAWVVACASYTVRDIGTIDAAASELFGETFLANLAGTVPPGDLAKMSAAFVVKRELLPGESDPQNLAATFPRVFAIHNSTGSDHGIFAGFDPATKKVEVYAFN